MTIQELEAEVARLRERLEMTHVWQLIDGKMQKVAVEPGSIPDGIDCRNETIKLQDAELSRLRSSPPGWREGIEAAAKVAEEWSAHCLADSIHGDPHGQAEAHVAAIIAGNIRELAALTPPGDKEKE